MIQRLQTVYLLIAGVLIGSLFFVPFAEITAKGANIYRYDLMGIYPGGIQKPEFVSGSLPLLLVWITSLMLILTTIFKFKNRILQMKLARIIIFIQLGFCGLIYYYLWSGSRALQGIYLIKIYLAFPIISAILIYLAIKAIAKDELLVRSIDRIR